MSGARLKTATVPRTAAAVGVAGNRAPARAAISAYSRKASSRVISTSTSVASGGNSQMTPTTSRSSAAALRMRVMRFARYRPTTTGCGLMPP